MIETIGGSTTPFGFNSITTMTHFFGLKMAFLIPILVWFFTSHNWWKLGLFSSIILTIFQIWEAFQSSSTADEISFFYSAPWIILLIALLQYLDKKVNYVTYLQKSKNEIQEKIGEIIDSEDFQNNDLLKNKLDFEKINTDDESKEGEKLRELFRIREELLKNLEIKN